VLGGPAGAKVLLAEANGHTETLKGNILTPSSRWSKGPGSNYSAKGLSKEWRRRSARGHECTTVLVHQQSVNVDTVLRMGRGYHHTSKDVAIFIKVDVE
jgi:hypothetical protein